VVWATVLAFVGGVVLTVLVTALRGRFRGKSPKVAKKLEHVPADVYEAAFDQIEGDGVADVERRGNAVIFGLPPQASPQPEPKVVEMDTSEDQVIVENHPCNLLSGVIPHNFRKAECVGVCQAAGQRGRPCFWASNSASKCPYFKPRVNPTRVKLRKTG